MTTRDSPAADGAIRDDGVRSPSYRARIKAEGRIAIPTIVALSVGGITFLAEASLGWFTNWVETGGWQAEAFIYPFVFLPFGIVATIVSSIIAGAGFGWKNRLLGILAGSLPLLGVLALAVVTTIPGAMPPGAG